MARSQEQIRKLLQGNGALGVSFESTWGPDEPHCIVRFVWPLKLREGHTTNQGIRLEVTPLPPDRSINDAQRERQAWRGLAWYLDGTIKAAAFGLIRFEDIFLSFMEIGRGEATLGKVVMDQIEEQGHLQIDQGRLALPPGQR